jgi:hypothetical protein
MEVPGFDLILYLCLIQLLHPLAPNCCQWYDLENHWGNKFNQKDLIDKLTMEYNGWPGIIN